MHVCGDSNFILPLYLKLHCSPYLRNTVRGTHFDRNITFFRTLRHPLMVGWDIAQTYVLYTLSRIPDTIISYTVSEEVIYFIFREYSRILNTKNVDPPHSL